MADYRVTITHTKSGKVETIDSDNVVVLTSFIKPDNTPGWTTMAHIQPATIAWLLKQPAVQGVVAKLDFSSLLGKFFGGQK